MNAEDLKKILKPEKDEFLSKLIRDFKDKPWSDLLDFLEKKEKLSWFLESKVGDLVKLKDLKVTINEEIVNEDLYEQKLLNLLSEVGLGESKRGISSAEILEKVGGNASSLRKVLDKLKGENKVYSTGKTQGMKWVPYSLRNEAEKNHKK